MENKLKHLEFIQNVITRMAANSFLLKGWSVTLASATFALAAKDSNRAFAIIAYIPIVTFWLLDGYFLSQERQYRDLFTVIAAKDETLIDFCMDASACEKGDNTWSSSCFSKTLRIFHGCLIVITLIVIGAIPQLK